MSARLAAAIVLSVGLLPGRCRVCPCPAFPYSATSIRHTGPPMDASETTQQSRLLTPDELGFCIRVFREARQWSQEQLAEISRLNVRTIQRVEKGETASLDTRRALASAFDFGDIDALNRPFHISSAEELKAAKEKFDREHVTLTALPLTRAGSWRSWRKAARWTYRSRRSSCRARRSRNSLP